jgi:hypothetical protein
MALITADLAPDARRVRADAVGACCGTDDVEHAILAMLI